MRYTLTLDDIDPDLMRIGVDKQMISHTRNFSGIQDIEKSFRLKYPFLPHLFFVDGVLRVILSSYQVTIIKGTAFYWREMLPAVLSILRLSLSPHDELEEVREPMIACVVDGVVHIYPTEI